MWRNRLVKNRGRLQPWRNREGVSSYRCYDRDIPELPFQVDLYEGEVAGAPGVVVRAAVIVAFAPRHGGGATFDEFARACSVVVGEVFDITAERMFLQLRERERGGEVEADDLDASVLRLVVEEGPARLLLRLGARRDPGLFLDHRTTRALVAAEAKGKRLLNLFAYTASFSVQAALAGASSTTSMDLSPKTTRWAEANLAENQLDARAHQVVCRDVLAFLESSEEEGAFDIVVVDPPSFSRSKRAARDFDVARDHPWLVRAALEKCRPRGAVWFSTNRREFELSPELAGATELIFHDVSDATRPFDFQRSPHRCFRVHRR